MRSVAAVILAAGASTRMGEPKQLAMLAGERLLERAVRVATDAGCNPVVVVLGSHAERIREKCSLGTARVAMNEAWPDGMASSIRCGMIEVGVITEGAILMTCDQPAVTTEHLWRLMALCAVEPVASSYAGRRGVPAVFPASYFAALVALEGDAGARRFLETAQAVELPGGELDIDTPTALANARLLYES